MTNYPYSTNQTLQIPPKPPDITHANGGNYNTSIVKTQSPPITIFPAPQKPTLSFKDMLLVNSEEIHLFMQQEEPHTQSMPITSPIKDLVQPCSHTQEMVEISEKLQINLLVDDL